MPANSAALPEEISQEPGLSGLYGFSGLFSLSGLFYCSCLYSSFGRDLKIDNNKLLKFEANFEAEKMAGIISAGNPGWVNEFLPHVSSF